jgi:hypothetical protein
VLAHPTGDVEHPDLPLVVDQLEQVAIPGDHVDRHRGRAGQGADHVVGLVPVVPDHGQSQSVQHGEDQRHLHGQVVGGGLAAVPGGAGHRGHRRVTRLGDPVGLVGRE